MIYQITYTKDGNGRNKKVARPVKDRAELMALRNSKENLELLAKARQGDGEAKAKLLQLAYNIGHVDGLLAGCESQGSFFFHDVDCYDAEQSKAIKDLILSKKDEIGLRMLERSVGGGWHLVCRREKGKTILENQVRVALALKLEMDTNTHDLQRVVYSTSGEAEDLVYLDDEIFTEPMAKEECEAEWKMMKEREKKGLEEVPAGAKKANKHYKPWEDGAAGLLPLNRGSQRGSEQGHKTVVQTTPTPPNSGGEGCAEKKVDQTTPNPSYSGGEIEADERTRFIFGECMKEEGVTESDLTDEGGRHNSVKMVLSCCNQLLTQGETLGVLKELMPDHWQDENIQTLVNAYYTEYLNTNQRLTMFQKRVFRESRRISSQESSSQESGEGNQESGEKSQSELSRIFASKTPPELPPTLPKLVKTVTSCTPARFKATVAQAIFPPLATYPRQLAFVYTDNQIRELRINCLIVAPTGTGKDSCTSQPLEHITAEMEQRDEINRERLRKFNEDYNSQANNKVKPKRPADLIIQCIMSDITKAGLVQRMAEAQKAPLYVKLNELEQWDKIEGATGKSNQFTTLKLCDDESNKFGSDRAGTQSVTVSGKLHLNWNANTTIPKVIRYFSHVLTDGPISRLCLATVPKGEIGADIAVFGNYDSTYDEALKPFIDNLRSATGVIDCQQAKRLARRLKQECAEFARLSQDEVFDNLTHRALVHAFRKACLLYAANGMKWEKAIESFCRWSLFYDLYLKMKLWGDLIRHADDDVHTSKRGPRNLLESIPTGEDQIFRFSDAVAARLKNGKSEEGTMNMLSQWKVRGYILQMTDDSFKKVKPTKR